MFGDSGNNGYSQMNWLVRALLSLVFALLCAGLVQAGDFEDGAAAYKRRDYATALAKWRSAAQQGNRDAHTVIGLMYWEGKGVAQDYTEAVRWYQLAAQQGEVEAQYYLGFVYDEGQGVAQDYKEAMRWYKLAALQGSAMAQGNLGLMYDKGKGVEQDYKEAVRWYKSAARQDLSTAQYNLGLMYHNGKGVLQDYVLAHMWFNIAAVGGDGGIVKGRDALARKMTAQQIEQAQRMARECMSSKFLKCD